MEDIYRSLRDSIGLRDSVSNNNNRQIIISNICGVTPTFFKLETMTLSESATILMGYWPILLGMIATVWWLSRLETRITSNTARIIALEKEKSVIYEIRDAVNSQGSDIKEMNAKLEILVPNYKK